MQFTVEIELGNAAMATPQDVAHALRDAAQRLEDGAIFPSSLHEAPIRDKNGNTVGGFFTTG